MIRWCFLATMIDYESFTREELIELLKELERKRAFSFEDQMKLLILDESPFTIWASDRDCKITFWSGKCESLYGYTASQAIGQDYVDLFVAEDERVAARKDQLSIIDDGIVFHNMANDQGKNGNVLHLITNCRRIKNPENGEYWNAEMGLIIDYYEDERERLNQVIQESQKIKNCITQFLESVEQYKEQFNDRKLSVNSTLRKCERNAIKLNKRAECHSKVEGIRQTINTIEDSLLITIENYMNSIRSCNDSQDCERIRKKFMRKHEEIVSDFEDVVLDVEEVSQEYQITNDGMIEKDVILREAHNHNSSLTEKIHSLKIKADDNISEYRSLNPSANSDRMRTLQNQNNEVERIKNEIDEFFDDLRRRVLSASDLGELQTIREEMLRTTSEFTEELDRLSEQIG